MSSDGEDSPQDTLSALKVVEILAMTIVSMENNVGMKRSQELQCECAHESVHNPIQLWEALGL